MHLEFLQKVIHITNTEADMGDMGVISIQQHREKKDGLFYMYSSLNSTQDVLYNVVQFAHMRGAW